MIEDTELRQLFEQESREHIDGLESGIMALEQDASDRETRDRTMREAHSLKGASRMLGLAEIELLSHRIESLLRTRIDDASALPAPVASLLLQAVDALRALSQTAVDDSPSQVNVQALISQIDAAEGGAPALKSLSPTLAPVTPDANTASESPRPVPTPQYVRPPPPQNVTAPHTPNQAGAAQTPADSAPAETTLSSLDQAKASIANTEKYRIDTIRVAPEKLDHLMTQMGELVVIQKRVSGMQRHIDAINKNWEELLRAQRVLVRHQSLHSSSDQQGPELQRALNQLQEAHASVNTLLETLTQNASDDASRLEGVTSRLENSVRSARMMPLSIVFEQFRRMVRDIASMLEKEVELVIEGGETLADKRIVEEIKDPLMHLIRNALHHGIESPSERTSLGKSSCGTITIRGRQSANAIVIDISDDGRGLNLEKIRSKALKLGFVQATELDDMSEDQICALIFRSGLSTQDMITDLSGRGVGLDVVRSNVEGLKGDVHVSSQDHLGTSFHISLPQNFATSSLILVDIQGQMFGLPVEYVDAVSQVSPTELYELEGQMTLTHNDRVVTIAQASALLGMPSVYRGLPDNEELPCAFIKINDTVLGLLVTQVIGEQNILMKPPGAMLKRVRHVQGVGILSTGEICTVLSPRDLIDSAHRQGSQAMTSSSHGASTARRHKILLVEDSMITRVQEKRHLEAAGFEVIATPDGQEAWNKLQKEPVDAVVSDILMPRMSGFELTQKIRSESQFVDLPVILVTTLASEEDRKRGLQVGANGYIIKAQFDPTSLIETLHRLIGGHG